MLSQKTALQLVLCLTIGFSAAACSDDGGETDNSTSTSTSTSASGSATSSSSAGQGGGTGGTDGQGGGTGGSDVGTGGQGGGTGGSDVGTGGQGGGTGGAGTGGEGGEGGSAPAGDPLCGAGTATFADVRPILTTTCAGCHGNAGPAAAGLDLRANAAHGELVNGNSTECTGRKLVVPGKPSESYIINKVRGSGLCGDDTRMPPPDSGNALPEASIKKINDWICAGAPQQ
ncbi:c-type cytochrome domain-containing protein [Sorangium sp. So ce426]|uniref:c-type cytochrome domain-containing protein n=1 Tax=Sorangium sp. So ce426 TaxID=3133312 RepID=UPI003F5C9251